MSNPLRALRRKATRSLQDTKDLFISELAKCPVCDGRKTGDDGQVCENCNGEGMLHRFLPLVPTLEALGFVRKK